MSRAQRRAQRIQQGTVWGGMVRPWASSVTATWDRGMGCSSTRLQVPLGSSARRTKGHIPFGVANWMRTLLQPSVMMKDCLPTRLHSVSRDTEHLNTHTSSSAGGERRA